MALIEESVKSLLSQLSAIILPIAVQLHGLTTFGAGQVAGYKIISG